MSRIVRIHNPVAAYNRRRPVVERPEKGKGSYDRKRGKDAVKDEQGSYQKGKQETND